CQLHPEIENEVEQLTSEILTAHGNASKPVTHSEVPFVQEKSNLYRQQAWEDNLHSLDAEDGTLWGTAKAFRRKAAPISALNGPTGTALSDTTKQKL
ncbi:uncharacterized protein TNCV_788701, partial [Trichonephila clavipes]